MEPWQTELFNKMLDSKHVLTLTARRSGKSEALYAYVEYFAELEKQERMQTETRKELLAAGWIPMECSKYFHQNWSECHEQCREIFGEKGYTWTGEIFWFRSVEDAFWFKMTF
jgi:hypothetical protein